MENNITHSSAEQMRLQSARRANEICQKYGVYGNVVFYSPSPIPDSDRNRPYIVAGIHPAICGDKIPSWIHPDEIIRNAERNHKLFYTKVWAYDLMAEKNDIQAQQDLTEYCKAVDFLSQLYGEYGAELPDKLRVSEINQLIEYRSILDNPDADPGLLRRARKALNTFFKREKSKSTFQKNWLSYYRSEQFPDNKGFIGRLRGYFNRNSNKASVNRLLEVNGKLHKLEMGEHEFKIFAKLMEEKHPDVVFSVGNKEVVDHGLIGSPNGSAFGRPVTQEEYDVIRKERFATESFAAVADLRPAYWEFRDVYYKAVDEPLIAGVYNQIALCYAKCNSLMELKERGDLRLARIPASDFMNFVSLAKANKLRFYIDNDGDFATPSLEFVNVIYNAHQEGKMQGITDRMIHDKVEFSHLLDSRNPSLSERLHSISQKLPEPPRTQAPKTRMREGDSHEF